MLMEKAQENKTELKKSHLEAAMDSVGLKHVTRDTVDELCLKITTSWPRTRREIPSQNDAAPGHMQTKPSVSSGGGGNAATAALSGAREERIRDKRKHEGEELSVPNDGKTRKTGPESTESRADGEGLKDATEEVPVSPHGTKVTVMQDVGGGGATLEYHSLDKAMWAHLEFEDGQIVPLKNSVSTSFYIGREPSPPEHHHRFYHEADNVWRRVSAKHCHILRLDTGSFASCIFRLTRVLLILMKYVN